MTKSFDKRTDVKVSCSCGCGMVSISQWYYDGKPEGVDLTYYIMARRGTFNLLNRLKLIWYILIGKEYIVYDLALTSKEEIVKFKEAVASLDENIE